jgi:SAM domain (Sterile alpha motif)
LVGSGSAPVARALTVGPRGGQRVSGVGCGASVSKKIDETAFPSLRRETLKELGVAPFGHRVKLLDAIAALGDDAGGKAPSVDAANRWGAPSARAEDRAERREVTVMFSDLVGSTALSARMDP